METAIMGLHRVLGLGCCHEQLSPEQMNPKSCMSYGLNSLKEGHMEDYIGMPFR